jgi:hypothetical protein
MASFRLVAALVAGLAASAVFTGAAAPAEAGTRYRVENGKIVPKRSAVRVKGYVARRGGGYSYNQFDVINTYGDSRGQFGRANSFRDPQLGRQTEAGPFDNGFFFDSGIGLHGGDAPYTH